ncbi:MAG TPA: NBR1-Ig-like domain-containing protein [Anaerolineales bacterium]
MKFRRIFTPVVLIVTLLVQFLPGTVFGPRPVAATTACDAAQFMGDITIQDGTPVAPGAALSKTWRFKNVGTCTWTTSYAVVFYSGTKMGAPSVVNLPTSVAPGATVDVTVNMTAPTAPGHYRGYWMLRKASNVLFGVGPYGTYWFFIDIVVTGSPTTTTAYDFVANCSAANWTSGWTTGARALLCPGVDGSASGYVLQSAAPQLEDGTLATTPGLIVAPNNDTDGFISGTYPAFTVQSGDRFQSIVSCQYGVSSCYVTFRLDYQIDDGLVYTLWSFREKTEGSYYRASVDLSSLAGRSVKFILKVTASGSPAGDRVVWGGTRIVRAGGTPPPPPVSTCDKAAFVTDVNYPDGTPLAGGTSFTKIWRVKNVGTCTWTTSYRLVFAGGDIMGASASAFNLPTSVAPGGTIDLSVNLTAPITAGEYNGYWKLRNASGADFGVGASGTVPLLVKIKVVGSYGSVYDFVTNACSASVTWTSGAGALPCPGADGDSRGFVLPLGSHQMENGVTSSEGLLTFPQYVTDGYIQGRYPGFTVQSGDHFQSYVGCQFGGPANCYIIFRLAYQIGSGPVYILKTAAERYEGLVYRMDVDLSALAGQTVNFILMVQAFGSPSGDRAVWSAPQIVRSGAIPPTPTTVNVYFLDSARYVANTLPFETAVTRPVSLSKTNPETVLTQLFLGPTPAELTAGLKVILSGTTGYSSLAIADDSVARVYLTGTCASGGATYTIANLIVKNLKQFSTILWVKIYDQSATTEVPTGQSDSIPACLEP